MIASPALTCLKEICKAFHARAFVCKVRQNHHHAVPVSNENVSGEHCHIAAGNRDGVNASCRVRLVGADGFE